MELQWIRSEKLGEQYARLEHPSGLTMLLCPMEGYSSAYAMLTTKYGSVDSGFKIGEGEAFHIPAGTAHYLEHKMFESPQGDAFEFYAKTGASPNAYTSWDKTCYYFTCTEQFKESLEILLESVTQPYFTPQTVAKEQGIIGQEIRMYEDTPDWRVLFNLLEALYQEHPIRNDIAGTLESIATITDQTLYSVYGAFYNLRNMVLTVAGNFQIDEVLAVADEILKPAPKLELQRLSVAEPREIGRAYVEQQLPVAAPLFSIGFKGQDQGEQKNLRNLILDELVIDLVCGEMTPLYRSLYEDGLLSGSLNQEILASRDYCCTLVEGESRDPKELYRRLLAEVERLKVEGFDEELFRRSKKAAYGRYIGLYSHPASVASVLVSTYFADMTLYDLLEQVAAVTTEQLEQRLRENLLPQYSALSVVSAQPLED